MSARPSRALLRQPSPAFAAAYAPRSIAIDQQSAARQHAAYAHALRAAGLRVDTLPADPAWFDSVFIEDAAVVWGDRALITSMAPHREGEQPAVEAALRATHDIGRLPEGALLEGGDVLHIEDVTYVGISSRTNTAGADALAALLAPRLVVRIGVERCLHLKTGATWLGDGRLLVAPSRIDPRAFVPLPGAPPFEFIEVSEAEAPAANAIRLPDALLIAAGRPRAADALARFCAPRGLTLHALDISEFEKADGSLTCMSILL